jgi:putative ABC transport system permease protein
VSQTLALASLRSLARHPWQIALSIAGIALGVAVVVGIDLASLSARRAFELSSEALIGRATHAISAPGGVPDELYSRLRRGEPELDVAPVIERGVRALGDSPRTMTLLGVDPIADAAVRPWLSGNDGALSRDRRSSTTDLLTKHGTALIARSAAQALGVSLGGELSLRVDSRVEALRVLGWLEPQDELARRALEGLIVVDIATAQELCQFEGRLTRIDVAVSDASKGAIERLRTSLPPGTTLAPANERSEGLADMARAFDLNLSMLALLALLVGMFLIYNTMTFSVVQRREMIGAMRTLGVTRAQVFAAVASEALWIGALGTVIGVALGTLLARGLVQLTTRTINDLYFTVAVSDVELAPRELARGVVLGLGATLAGALAPAFEATRCAPRVAQMRSSIELATRGRAVRFAIAGALLAAIAALCLATPGRRLDTAFIGLFALLGAFALAVPAACLAIARFAAAPLGSIFGSFGRQAARGVVANLSRTWIAVAALSIAIAATVGMGVMIASFRSTLARWLEISLRADIYVSAPSLQASRNLSTLDPALVERVRREPGIDAIGTYRGTLLDTPRGPLNVGAIEVPGREESSFHFLAGEPAEVWRAFRSGAVIVSEPFAWRHEVGVGDELELPTDDGPRKFAIAGVYSDYTSDRGFVMLERATYERFWRDRGIGSLAIFAKPGTDPSELIGRLRALVPGDEQVLIRPSRVLREVSLALFERTFKITDVLRLLATAVAFIGVVSALFALELERARELAILRALGAFPRDIATLVLTESGLMGAIAGVLALPLGLALALVLTHVVNRRSFGWTLAIEIPPGVLAAAVGLALAAALVAGIYPAWRMSRAPIARALRGD